MIGKVVDGLLKKTWTQEEIQMYVGEYKNAYLSYAQDLQIREKAASGGVTSALLIYGLQNNLFDGAIVAKTVILNGKVRVQFEIATTKEQILAARGSKYVETKFLQEVLPLIRAFNGRVAVVGLPCDITALTNRCSKEPLLNQKIALKIALVCGHNSRVELIDHVSSQIEKEAGKKIVDYRFRVGHWRGRLEAEFEDKSIVTKHTKNFNDYQNLFYFCEKKCMACHDHYGYAADISIGDVWLFRLKANPIKHSGLIIRTEVGELIYNSAVKSLLLNSTPLDVRDIMDGQSRIGPSHYNVSARVKAGKLLGIKLKDTVKQKVSWHEFLNAFMSLANMRLSEKKWGKKLIFYTPRTILKASLYFKKALESIK